MKSVAARSEDGKGWVAECQRHSCFVNASSKRDARETDTVNFCDGCREEDAKPRFSLLSTCNERTLFSVHRVGCRYIAKSLRVVSQHRIQDFATVEDAVRSAMDCNGPGSYIREEITVHGCAK